MACISAKVSLLKELDAGKVRGGEITTVRSQGELEKTGQNTMNLQPCIKYLL
jgi:hypothetical protein